MIVSEIGRKIRSGPALLGKTYRSYSESLCGIPEDGNRATGFQSGTICLGATVSSSEDPSTNGESPCDCKISLLLLIQAPPS
jgi:hypothetical protein